MNEEKILKIKESFGSIIDIEWTIQGDTLTLKVASGTSGNMNNYNIVQRGDVVTSKLSDFQNL